MEISDLLKAAGGEAGLPSSLGMWRQVVSRELEGLLTAARAAVPGGVVLPPAPVSVLATFGSFYALKPGDNADPIAVGDPMLFPQDGPFSVITRNGVDPGAFLLPAIGAYEVSWQVSITEAGQLMLELNGSELAETVAGRATGTNQLVNRAVIVTTLVNSVLRLVNPSGNPIPLTVTSSAGGTHAVSAWLVIKRVG